MGGNSSGFTNEQSPQGGAFSRDLQDQKSKFPLFPGAWGGQWLQMISALLSVTFPKILQLGTWLQMTVQSIRYWLTSGGREDRAVLDILQQNII